MDYKISNFAVTINSVYKNHFPGVGVWSGSLDTKIDGVVPLGLPDPDPERT